MHVVVKLALAPLLIAQAVRTRRRALVLPEAAGPRRGRIEASPDAAGSEACAGGAGADERAAIGRPALRLLVAGDSSAAGVGVDHQDRAVVGHLARALHARLGVAVEWALHARSGVTTRGTHALLEAEPPSPVDVAIVVTGVNDVIDQVPVRRALRHRAALAQWLLGQRRARHVVFAPLPPMHRFPLLPEPLRRVMGADARRHDAALARWAAAQARVSRAAFEIDLRPETMAVDGFHPGEPLYRACAEALAAHVAGHVWPKLRAADQALDGASESGPDRAEDGMPSRSMGSVAGSTMDNEAGRPSSFGHTEVAAAARENA
jgi:lysophospholipase L1-like esterase